MASSSKKKTTFAKLNREAAVRERRQIKEARKAARKLAGDDAPVDTIEAPTTPQTLATDAYDAFGNPLAAAKR